VNSERRDRTVISSYGSFAATIEHFLDTLTIKTNPGKSALQGREPSRNKIAHRRFVLSVLLPGIVAPVRLGAVEVGKSGCCRRADFEDPAPYRNSGTFALATGGCLAISAPTTLTGVGTVQMNGNSCIFGPVTNTLTNESTIQGSGSIGDSNPMGFTNRGTVIANQSSPLTIVSAGTGFSNTGSVTVNAGSTLTVNGQIKNLSKGILTGGTYSVAGTMQLENARYTTITTNSSNITLTGAAAQILNGVGGPSALASFAINGARGIFSVQNGQMLSTGVNFTNQGKFTVSTASGFGIGATYTQTGGTTTVDGVISAPTGFNLNNGKLFGAGTINGKVNCRRRS
jgi:fibronectin-binding autotransporter adhesin